MSTIVLDASVAIKWSFPEAMEPLIEESLRLFRRYRDGEVDIVVPDIFWAEIGNVLCKGVKRGRWSRTRAEGIAADFARRDFTTVPSLALFSEALNIALTHDQSLYDCFYAALAVEASANLITADERLANALAARFPVKWLGAL